MEARWRRMGQWARTLSLEQLQAMQVAAENTLAAATGASIKPAREEWEDIATVCLDFEHLLLLTLDERDAICDPAAQPMDGLVFTKLALYERNFTMNPAYYDDPPHAIAPQSPQRKRLRSNDNEESVPA